MCMLGPIYRLNILQFCATINENYYKMLVAFFLILLHPNEPISEVMSHTGFLFLLPFILFSIPGGILADAFSKRSIIILSRFIECLLILLAALFFFLSSSIGCQILLFLLATTSALFGPSKYGIIPEIHPKNKILAANSLIASFTFFGIILGSTAASFFIDHRNNFVIPLLFSLFLTSVGLLFSFLLPKTPKPKKAFTLPPFIYGEVWIAMREMSKIPHLLPVAFSSAYFLFIGAFIQLNVVDYANAFLSLSPSWGGYLFLLAAIGMSLGAYTSAKWTKGEIHLKMIPLSGFLISISLFLLGILPPHLLSTFLLLLMTGFFGGMFLVPAQAFLLKASPEESRGRNFSTASTLSFSLALLAPLILSLFILHLGWTSKEAFIATSILNALVMVLFSRFL